MEKEGQGAGGQVGKEKNRDREDRGIERQREGWGAGQWGRDRTGSGTQEYREKRRYREEGGMIGTEMEKEKRNREEDRGTERKSVGQGAGQRAGEKTTDGGAEDRDRASKMNGKQDNGMQKEKH